jgi:hypothetical protein
MPKKVDYLSEKYGLMHRSVIPHPAKITSSNVRELKDMSFVFIAIDGGSAKETIVESLESFGIPFIDVGLGVYRKDDSLGATLRVTMSVDGRRTHTAARISFADQDEDEYDWNIQTADLNMLNAAMAVVRWKKYRGYYIDRKHEYHSTYTLARNQLVNGYCAE